MMSIVFSLEQMLNMYIKELSNEDYSSFPSVKALFDENLDESQKISDLLKLLADLKNKMSYVPYNYRKKLTREEFEEIARRIMEETDDEDMAGIDPDASHECIEYSDHDSTSGR
ncbi:unnamed protein product [Diabrotica balteata]|uniref:Uncharacterized protein n=1 Tax=Diabrotica balteata TaxID=107213 RepID=A0A9N9SS35_DIABA|nr:unnamed protein product [Diabrotica balteata]